MIKDSLIISLITFSIASFFAYIYISNKLKIVSKDLAQLYVENAVLKEYVDIVKSKGSVSDDLVDKENFIKFLSDSRDWAYKYIEDVQLGLTSFVNEVEPEISYFDEYGIVGSSYPHYDSMKKISEEYKKLKELLPKD
jgi:hypothetical protein